MTRNILSRGPLKLENSFLLLRFIYVLGMSIFQVLIPVLFISSYGATGYGKWVIALSIVAFVNFADFGFLSSVPNEVIKANSQNKRAEAQDLVTNLTAMIIIVAIIVISMATAAFLLSNYFFNFRIEEYIYILIIAACAQVFLRTVEGISRAFVSSRGFLILVLSYFFESLLLLIGILLEFDYTDLSLILLGSRTIFCIYGLLGCSRYLSMKSIFNIRLSNLLRFVKANVKSGVYFLFIPLGYLILFDGSNVVLGLYISEDFVAALSLLRISTGIIRQATSSILTSFYPSISQLVFSGNLSDLMLLHRKMKKLLLFSTTSLTFILVVSTDWLFSKFLDKSPLISREIFFFFLCTVIVDIPWNFRASYLIASNSHVQLGQYFFLSSLIALLVLYPLASNFGFYGVGVAFCVQDVVLTRLVFKKSTRILNGSKEES